MNEFSHFNNKGDAVMVDISQKSETTREAVACGKIYMSDVLYNMVIQGEMKKGDVLSVARIAGIMGAKKTSEIIPLCHIINLTKVEVDFEKNSEDNSITAYCTVKTVGKTGVEMEALTGVSTALLTIYDMCKAVDKKMIISDIGLIKKSGGKSGDWQR